jgi:hypothetical protein
VQLPALVVLGRVGAVQGTVVKGRAGRDGAVAAGRERVERPVAALLRWRKGLRVVIYLAVSVLLGLREKDKRGINGIYEKSVDGN